MKVILIITIFFLFAVQNINSQPTYIIKYEKIIKQGLPNYYTSNAELKQLTYLTACEKLGDYYIKKYEKRKILGTKKAIHYYKLVADLGLGTEMPLRDNNNILKVFENCCQKIGDIYLYGKAVSINKQVAFRYHIKNYKNLNTAIKYSKIYFKEFHKIYLPKKISQNDTSVLIIFNPFLLKFNEVDFEKNKNLNSITNKLIQNKDVVCKTYFSCILKSSELETFRMNSILKSLKKFFLKNYKDPGDRFIFDSSITYNGCNYFKTYNLNGIEVDVLKLVFKK